MKDFTPEKYERLKKYMKDNYNFTPENMHEHEGYKKSISQWTNHPDSDGGRVWKII